MGAKSKDSRQWELLKLVLIIAIGFPVIRSENLRVSTEGEGFLCGNGTRIPMEKRCDLKKDCLDELDEEGCSNYPRAKLVAPFQIEDRWWFRGLWVEMEKSRMSFNVLGGTVRSPYKDRNWISYFYCRYSRDYFHWIGVVTYNRFDKSYSCHSSQDSKHVLIEKGFQILQKNEETSYTWVKSTKGHAPDGAVMLGLTFNYTVTFTCTLAEYHLQGAHYQKMMILRGALIPSRGGCWIPMVLMEFENPHRMDYDVQVNAEFIKDTNCEQSNTFQCGDGTCILEEFVCDGQLDCRNGRDENITRCRELNNCSDSTFPCSDGKCIPNAKTCELRQGNGSLDSKINCHDGNDESIRTCGYVIHGSDVASTCKGFTCELDKLCIPKILRCDGAPRCNDVSDERDCGMEICRHDKLKCYSTQKIIEARYWKQAPWTRYKMAINNTLFTAYQSDIATKQVLCRVTEAWVQKSVLAIGTLERDKGPRPYVCKDSEFRSESYGFLNTAYEVLIDSEGSSWGWVDLNSGDIPDGGLVGGLTEEFEIYFICRWYRGDRGAWFFGRFRVRLGLCDYPRFSKMRPISQIGVLQLAKSLPQVLVDTKYNALQE